MYYLFLIGLICFLSIYCILAFSVMRQIREIGRGVFDNMDHQFLRLRSQVYSLFENARDTKKKTRAPRKSKDDKEKNIASKK